MNQTIALFVDAYRELNAKRLFWFTLLLSGLGVAAFALISNNERGLSVLGWWTLDIPILSTRIIPASEFHKLCFVNLGLEIWLTWIAMILAIISTASIFPDFLAGGAIELTLSKPIGRLRLFFTKYAAALLFVGLQVAVFSIASFFVIGFHGGGWIPAIFLAIPIVTLVFSYLFSICVFFGVLWRSTVAALMLTMLAWGLIFLINTSELALLTFKIGLWEGDVRQVERIDSLRSSIEETRTSISAGGTENIPAAPLPERPKEGGLLAGLKWAANNIKQSESTPELRLKAQEERLERLETRLTETRGTARSLNWWYDMIYGVKTALPKTAETTALMKRYMLDLGKLEQLSAAAAAEDNPPPHFNAPGESDDPPVSDRAVGAQVKTEIESRTELWIIGTSLGFEAVVLGIAAFIFCRRDF